MCVEVTANDNLTVQVNVTIFQNISNLAQICEKKGRVLNECFQKDTKAFAIFQTK